MYGKIFDSMYDGTLAEDWRALITFQQFIVLCDADGIIDMTPSAISRRTGIPIEHIKAGIEILGNPDPCSRTNTEEGRRISLLDEHKPWGWYIVNHNKYKNMQDSDTVRAQNRERKRRQRERLSSSNKESRSVTDSHSPSLYTDTDTDTNKKTKMGFAPPPVDEVRSYCQERNNNVDPQSFIDHYEANGWFRGKTKIKDWKACVRTWEKTSGKKEAPVL